MKMLSIVVLSCSLICSLNLFAQKQEYRPCTCKNCQCTYQSHCGCLSENGCHCTEDCPCGSNCQSGN